MKPKILVVGFILLASCAAHRPVFDPKFITDNEVFAAIAADPEVFKIGELEIRIYKDRAKLVADLPPLLKAVNGMGNKVVGFYDRQRRILYSVEDLRVLLHELKHALEPDWKHSVDCAALPCH